jgi:hypothetical protein
VAVDEFRLIRDDLRDVQANTRSLVNLSGSMDREFRTRIERLEKELNLDSKSRARHAGYTRSISIERVLRWGRGVSDVRQCATVRGPKPFRFAPLQSIRNGAPGRVLAEPRGISAAGSTSPRGVSSRRPARHRLSYERGEQRDGWGMNFCPCQDRQPIIYQTDSIPDGATGF